MKQSKDQKSRYLNRYLLNPLALVLCLTGCYLTPTGSSSTVATSATSNAISSPASVQPSSMVSSSSEPPSSSITASQLEQLEKIRLVMFQAGSDGQVICAFNKSEPLATGMYGINLVWNKIDRDPQFYLYNIQYPYTSFPAEPSVSLSYSEIHGSRYTEAGYSWNFGGWIAFTDDIYPFNFPVTHHAYTADAQPARADWKAAFIPLLEEKIFYYKEYSISDTPLIITDVWRFDLDGDGVDEELVRACNEVKIPMTDQEVKPASQSTGVYNKMIFFSKTLETTVISNERTYIGNITEEELYSYQYKSIKGSGWGTGTTDTGVWQYDSKGNLILCPYFKYGEYGIYRAQIPIVCDADGDGKPELIVIKCPSEYWQVAVYKAGLENGELLWCENTMHP